MLSDRIKIIKAAENSAAERKEKAREKCRRMMEEAAARGNAIIAAAEAEVAESERAADAKIQSMHNSIIEKATTEAKLSIIAKKVDAEQNMPSAARIIIEELQYNIRQVKNI